MSDITHIGVGSRYDRDLDAWVEQLGDWLTGASILTVTDTADIRPLLVDAGWGYHAFAQPGVGLASLIAWDTAVWRCGRVVDRLLSSAPSSSILIASMKPVYVTGVLLSSVSTNQELLVSAGAIPPYVEGDGWPNVTKRWSARKTAYAHRLGTMAELVRMWQRSYGPEAVLVTADFNLDLKQDWARDVVEGNFSYYRPGWEQFPTMGTGLGCSKVIVGSMHYGLTPTASAQVLGTQGSSEHRAYRGDYGWGELSDPIQAEGDVYPGDPWWGFGDLAEDEALTL